MNTITTSLLKKGSLLLISALFFTACSEEKAEPTPQNGKISLFVSSPGAVEFSLLVNGTKLPTSRPLVYNTVIGYSDITPGAKEFIFTKKDGTEALAKISGTISPSTNYTLVLGDKSPKTSLIFIEDDLSAPADDKAKVRFANLSPETTALDLYLQGKTEAGISKKSFNEVSGFINVDPAEEVKMEIRENGKTVVLATREKFKIEKGKIYTIWTRGLKDGGEANPLGIEVMTNK